jgi:hypothetical protein
MTEDELIRVRQNVLTSSTEDLLDRVTVYRDGMDPAALEVIEAELRRRGVSQEAVTAHDLSQRATVKTDSEGRALVCQVCHRPAVVVRWEWFRLFWIIPVFPVRPVGYCAEHAAGASWW